MTLVEYGKLPIAQKTITQPYIYGHSVPTGLLVPTIPEALFLCLHMLKEGCFRYPILGVQSHSENTLGGRFHNRPVKFVGLLLLRYGWAIFVNNHFFQLQVVQDLSRFTRFFFSVFAVRSFLVIAP